MNKINVMQNYHFPIIIENDIDGYTASCPSLQGCYAQGTTYEEVVKNIEDVIRLHIEDRKAQNEEILEPARVSLSSIDISMEE